MNKEFLLENLILKDLEPHSDMHDVGVESGIEIVKELYRKHEGLKLYVPNLSSNKSLIVRVLLENKYKCTEYELARQVGWRVDQVKYVLYHRSK